MEQHLIISASGPWYTLIYSIAFLTGFLILLYEGFYRKYPILKWILLLAITQTAIIAGSKIITFHPSEWNFLFTTLNLPATDKKSLAGGLIAGVAVLYAGRYILRFRPNPADAFAVALPVTLAIQRIGCFISGCCFGKACDLPWAVIYPVNTLPHYHQYTNGLISGSFHISLPVHPVQLYEMVLLMLLAAVAVVLRKRMNRSGSLMMLSLAGVLLIRFTTEFFRSPLAHTTGGQSVGILNLTQVVALLIALPVILSLWKRERKEADQQTLRGPDIGLKEAIAFFLPVTLLLWSLRNWLVPPELIALAPVMLLASLILLSRVVIHFLDMPYKWLYPVALIVPLFLMAQTYPGNQAKESYKKYHSLRLGFAGGNAVNSLNIGTGEGCDRIGQTDYFEHSYTLAGAGYEVTYLFDKPFEQLNLGIKGFLASHREIRLSDQYRTDNQWFGITPYGNLETNFFGFGLGIHLGKFGIIYLNRREEGTGKPQTGINTASFYPQLYVRIGPRKYGYVDYRLADQFPSALPGYLHQLGIGSGLGRTDGTALRFGGSGENMVYLSGTFPIRDTYVIEPLLLMGQSTTNKTDKNFYQISVGLTYRFGHKENEGKRVINP